MRGADKYIISSQSFLTEVYTDRKRAMATFERLIRRSQCRYIVFIDNMYDKVRELMNDLSGCLNDKGLTRHRAYAATATIRPNFRLPQVTQQHLFTGEDGLIPRYSV